MGLFDFFDFWKKWGIDMVGRINGGGNLAELRWMEVMYWLLRLVVVLSFRRRWCF